MGGSNSRLLFFRGRGLKLISTFRTDADRHESQDRSHDSLFHHRALNGRVADSVGRPLADHGAPAVPSPSLTRRVRALNVRAMHAIHTNPTRQRGGIAPTLAGASG